MRILVTGSRDWLDFGMVESAIAGATSGTPTEAVVIVHGACPTGADDMAVDVAISLGFGLEEHPADWTKYGRRAGPIRNAEMVVLGADLCIAFIKDGSPGATFTMELARNAGIPVEVHRIWTPGRQPVAEALQVPD